MDNRPPLIEAQQMLEHTLGKGLDAGNLNPSYMVDRFAEIAERVATDDAPKLRMSYGNGCAREKWFVHNMPENAIPRDRSRLVHAMGDMWEIIALETLRVNLPYPWNLSTEYDQGELENFDGIKGHTDGALYYDSQPYAIIDPKFKEFNKTCRWWEPRVPKGIQQQPGDRRIPTDKWGEKHQAGNYVWTERDKGRDFLGFMWICGFRDQADKYHCAWMTADELKPYYEESKHTFEVARKSNVPPPPIHPDRDESPCMVWLHKGKGLKKIYCAHYHDCIKHS
jgi:hypothetical protein